jgi:TolB-like protein/Tfp pilus assembly protein PilF
VVLVVLPFVNLSGDPEQEYLSDGMTEEMIAQLAQLQPERLAVIARTSSMYYKKTEKRADEIARELGAHYLMEGSVRREGERVRVTAQLIRASDQLHVWSHSYDNDVGDVLSIQADVARSVADQIQLTLTPAQRRELAGARSVNPEAYEAYLRGREQWYRNDVPSLRRALDYFQQSVAADPNYALAHVGLADTYIFLGAYGALPMKESHPKARASAQRALELDRTLAGAHAALGVVSHEYEWDWRSAEDHFQRAIAHNPGHADAHRVYAEFLQWQNRIAEAQREAQTALEIDPHSPTADFALGVCYYFSRQHDKAIEHFEKLNQKYPTLSRGAIVLALIYVNAGQADRGVEVLERTAREPVTLEHKGVLAYAYARAGRTPEARKLLAELHPAAQKGEVAAAVIAIVHVGLGEKEQALDWLEKAYQAHEWHLTLINAEPVFDPLRDDPRFQDLLRRMNFSP